MTDHPPASEVRRARRILIGAGVLALLSILAIGGLLARQRYLTRGIPDNLPEPIAQAGPQLGLNVYLDELAPDAVDDALQEIRAIGVGVVKQPFYYTDAYDWQTADRLVQAFSQAGLTLVPLLDGNPADGFAPPANPADFAEWAGEFAGRYGDSIASYIIWDEPNITSHWGGRPVNPSEYAALLVASAAAIREADSDAVIIAAPLAPTTESGPRNLSETLFLAGLYEAGAADAFDVVAVKPYGFDTGPFDRDVATANLNFSRAILVREMLIARGDERKAVWAGNWGWNALPPDWTGPPSIWGQTDPEQQAAWIVEAMDRVRVEWPWMGLMFLENWQPDAPMNDPRWGFSIAERPAAEAIRAYQLRQRTDHAQPGFHPTDPGDPAQQFTGGWRFSPEYGADISQSGDRVRLQFWGTDVGVRVRRADFRARLYATIDGEPANALPRDENGAALVLTSADPSDDMIVIEPVARDLAPGPHTLELVASRGWDQWALNGFSVGYRPPTRQTNLALAGLSFFGGVMLLLGMAQIRKAQVRQLWQSVALPLAELGERRQVLLAALAGAVLAVSGWLTWNGQAESIYRRLGDSGQLAATALAASIFYVSPVFFLFAAALAALGLLLLFRPTLGLVLIAFAIPFYVPSVTKPILDYRFSPVEVFTLVTAAATLGHGLLAWARRRQDATAVPARRWTPADSAVLTFVVVATLSLFFTERLDVALNEWRVVIVEPVLFYVLLRVLRPSRREMSLILHAFVLSGLVIAIIGLAQYLTGTGLITAEGGLMRLRSIYGSPNNVGLYLGRIIPLLAAVVLFGWSAVSRPARALYLLTLAILALAVLLSFSKGALLLGIPAGLAVVFWMWQRSRGRAAWPWLVGFASLGVVVLAIASQVPALSARLNLFGETGVFRLNLWRSALGMIQDHPLFGVGLDNFLYAYRGRYILDAAWQEPNLNHPHNILLDAATRLGLVGLLAVMWLFMEAGRHVMQGWRRQLALRPRQLPWLGVTAGLAGMLADTVAHGIVDHSLFLVDLAYTFFLGLGVAVWIANRAGEDVDVSDHAGGR